MVTNIGLHAIHKDEKKWGAGRDCTQAARKEPERRNPEERQKGSGGKNPVGQKHDYTCTAEKKSWMSSGERRRKRTKGHRGEGTTARFRVLGVAVVVVIVAVVGVVAVVAACGAGGA